VFSNLLTSPGVATEVTRNPQFTVISMLSAHDLRAFDAYAKALGPTVVQAPWHAAVVELHTRTAL